MESNTQRRPITFRPTDEIESNMTKWLAQHTYIDRSTLINMALAKFLTSTQVLEGVGERVNATPRQVMEVLDQVMTEHRDSMDSLKTR